MRVPRPDKPSAASPRHPGPRSQASSKQQQVWPVDGCLCALALTNGSDWPPRCLPHQSLSLLSCCQLPLSFRDLQWDVTSSQPAPTIMGPPGYGRCRGPCPVACPHYSADSYGLTQFHAAPHGSQHALLHASGHINSLIPPFALPAALGGRQEAEHKPTLTSPRRLPAWRATACAISSFSATVGTQQLCARPVCHTLLLPAPCSEHGRLSCAHTHTGKKAVLLKFTLVNNKGKGCVLWPRRMNGGWATLHYFLGFGKMRNNWWFSFCMWYFHLVAVAPGVLVKCFFPVLCKETNK